MEESGVDPFVVVLVEKLGALTPGGCGGATRPDLGPIATSNLGLTLFVRNRSVGRKNAERGNASARVWELLLEGGDRVDGREGRRGRRRKEKSLGSSLKAVVRPSVTVEEHKSGEGGVEGQDAVEAGEVLERRREKAEKGEVLRNEERSRSLLDG